MKYLVFLRYVCVIIILSSSFVYSQNNTYTISGYITNKNSGESLIAALLFIENTNDVVLSNEYGFYSLSLPMGEYSISCSYIGFFDTTFVLDLQNNIQHNIQLVPQAYTLQNVVVYSGSNTISSKYKHMPIQYITKTPTVFGVPDVIKVMQLQPGIKTLGDGSSGMYVRGGNRDQNLVFIDEAYIYNVSHMYGYVSVFNPTMLHDVKFYSSFMPVEFGGRISSVLDAKMKEGNNSKHSGEITLSTLTLNTAIEGPIKKDTASYFFAVRKSTLDLILNRNPENVDIPSFYDINMKVNLKVNQKNRLFLSAYTSKDIINSTFFTNTSENVTSTFRWLHLVNSKLCITTSYIFNNYKNNSIFTLSKQKAHWETGVLDNALKTKLTYFLSQKHTIRFGSQITYHQIIPGQSGNSVTSISNMNMVETAFFIQHTISLHKNIDADYGVRYNTYQNTGDAYWYSLQENYQPLSIQTESACIWNTYHSLEPRIAINYSRKNNSISCAYTRTSQAMQILSNNALGYSSIETWIPCSPNIEPLFSNNYSLTFSHQNKKFSVLLEGYIRNIKNQIDYVDNAHLFSNPIIESEIRNGTAKSYGFEISFIKNSGAYNANVSYSYARVFYTIHGITTQDTYRAPYDIPHDIKIQNSYDFNTRVSCSAVWIFSSGRPGTFPRGYTIYGEKEIPVYSQRNGDSYPNYHRLDMSIRYRLKERKKTIHTCTFGVFNVYGRLNPILYQFDAIQGIVRVKSFYTSFPSFTYSIQFK